MAANPRELPEQSWLQFRAAEEKCKLKETLLYLGDVYNDEVTTQVKALTTAIEPILIVVLGVIVVSVFLPMTTMMNSLGGARHRSHHTLNLAQSPIQQGFCAYFIPKHSLAAELPLTIDPPRPALGSVDDLGVGVGGAAHRKRFRCGQRLN